MAQFRGILDIVRSYAELRWMVFPVAMRKISCIFVTLFFLLSIDTRADTQVHVPSIQDEQTINLHRKQLIEASLRLSEEEGKRFWPLYDEYVLALRSVFSRRSEIAYRFAEHFNDMTDDEALDISTLTLEMDKSYVRLAKSYLPRFISVIGGKKTARFYQIERRIRMFFEAEMSKRVPLFK